jgi:hypothetical protein
MSRNSEAIRTSASRRAGLRQIVFSSAPSALAQEKLGPPAPAAVPTKAVMAAKIARLALIRKAFGPTFYRLASRLLVVAGARKQRAGSHSGNLLSALFTNVVA